MNGLDGDEEDILVLEGYIGCRALDDALQVDRQDLLRAVGLHAANHGTREHRLFRQAVG